MPTDDERGFWAAIRANPADDTARLVYADWLQENGDEPRAAFIRLQCQIAAQQHDSRWRRKVMPGLIHRQDVLRTANAARWGESLFRLLVRPGSIKPEAWTRALRYERGFVTDLRLDLDGAHRIATAGDNLEPVQQVTVTHGWERYNAKKLAQLFAWDGVSCVSVFRFTGATDECVGTVTSATAARLTSLGFASGAITDAGAVSLAAWPCAATLRALDLSANRIGDAGAFALADSPHLAGLTALNLERNPIGRDGHRRLVARFGGNVLLPPERI